MGPSPRPRSRSATEPARRKEVLLDSAAGRRTTRGETMVADGGERRGVGGEGLERCSSEDTGGTARRRGGAGLEAPADLAPRVPLPTRAPTGPVTGPVA